MPNPPLMLSKMDKELVGASRRIDPLGLLPVWTERARDIVPYLTAQTTSVRGFQLLVEGIRLWEEFSSEHEKYTGDPASAATFFVLFEQTVARYIGDRWELPGSLRIKARARDMPHISSQESAWFLLNNQKANGIWGLYRGAAIRAGLLEPGLSAPVLSEQTHIEARTYPGLSPATATKFFQLILCAEEDGTVLCAMEGDTVRLPKKNSYLCKEIYNMYYKVPLKKHLEQCLVESHSLNCEMAKRLTVTEELKHREIIEQAKGELKEHSTTLMNVVRCENLLSVIEALFLGLCASDGKSLEQAMSDFQVDLTKFLTEFKKALIEFKRGHYTTTRQKDIYNGLRTQSGQELAKSIIELHKRVCDERGSSLWVWVENEIINVDEEVGDVRMPDPLKLQVEHAWRNDYYLTALQKISSQLKNLNK